MSKYTGKPFTVAKPAAVISDKFADLTSLQSMLDKLPAEERAKLGEVELEPDSIAVNTQQVGKIKFRVVGRTPEKVEMNAEGTPVPMSLDLDLKALTPTETEAVCSVDLQIPAMLRPMVAPHINKAVEMLSNVLKKAVE